MQFTIVTVKRVKLISRIFGKIISNRRTFIKN